MNDKEYIIYLEKELDVCTVENRKLLYRLETLEIDRDFALQQEYPPDQDTAPERQ